MPFFTPYVLTDNSVLSGVIDLKIRSRTSRNSSKASIKASFHDNKLNTEVWSFKGFLRVSNSRSQDQLSGDLLFCKEELAIRAAMADRIAMKMYQKPVQSNTTLIGSYAFCPADFDRAHLFFPCSGAIKFKNATGAGIAEYDFTEVQSSSLSQYSLSPTRAFWPRDGPYGLLALWPRIHTGSCTPRIHSSAGDR